ncbi:hypothetical protein PVAP13_6NG201403 [Panicum virgatum]|uniref:Retrotransposon gag domain-containing protein n=1 Tax=Panicum virgatum TaxID=38727 RepID=A0A8T0QY79_PANVG|nr:hypothetical protein PVAP13_6NG201403 [Panicum virgatum]
MAGENGEHPPSYVIEEQLQKLVQDFNDQLNENMVAAQKNMVAEVVKTLRAQGAAGSPEEELDEINEEYAARLQQEEQRRKNVLGRGIGRGHGNGAADEMIDPDTFRLHHNDNFQCHRNVINNHPNEAKFGKLKFSMPKFEVTSDPDAYLTWVLMLEKICVHNYSEEKQVHMAAVDFDGYALIWEMRARFIPKHYKRYLFDKLQNLKQGTKSVEEFYKEME